MKNSYKNKLLMFLIILLIILSLVLLINKIGTVKQNKQIIKEMTEGEYESQLTELNTSHEDYALQVQTNKQKLATAISNQKVTTSEDATIDEMVTNIGKIIQVGTSDATATAEDILEGKTAYANGELVTGTATNSGVGNIEIASANTTNTHSTRSYTYTTETEKTLVVYCVGGSNGGALTTQVTTNNNSSSIETVYSKKEGYEYNSVYAGSQCYIYEVDAPIGTTITAKTGKSKLPTHIEIGSRDSGLKADSVVLTEQIRTIDKSRLKEKIGHINDDVVMNKINNALGVSFGLGD